MFLFGGIFEENYSNVVHKLINAWNICEYPTKYFYMVCICIYRQIDIDKFIWGGGLTVFLWDLMAYSINIFEVF